MFKVHRIFFVFLFASSFLFLSAAASKAQQVPNYLFLEVIDSAQKPVAGATVEVKVFNNQIVKTNERGEANSYLPNSPSDFTNSLFKIFKPGYFSYHDLGTPMKSYDRLKLKVELLKIPTTKDERQALGREQLKREFLWAAKTGDAAAIRRFLKSGVSPNLSANNLRGVPVQQNIPAILFAAASGDGETVKILLKAGAKINPKDEATRDILAYYLRENFHLRRPPKIGAEKAAEAREYEAGAISLIEAGAKIDDLRNYGMTALMLAAQRGSPAIVKYLIDTNAPVNARDKGGATALMYAIYPAPEEKSAQIEIVDLLLKAGADVGAQSSRNENTLLAVARNSNRAVLKKLAAKGLFLNETNYDGMTAIMYLLYRVDYRGAFIAEAVKILLDAGADPNVSVTGFNGAASRKTALMLAAFKGDLEAMRALIAKGANVNFDLGDGDSALAAAARGGGDKIASVKLLIEAGADVTGKPGSVALKAAKMFSGRKADQDLIELLIAAGAK